MIPVSSDMTLHVFTTYKVLHCFADVNVQQYCTHLIFAVPLWSCSRASLRVCRPLSGVNEEGEHCRPLLRQHQLENAHFGQAG